MWSFPKWSVIISQMISDHFPINYEHFWNDFWAVLKLISEISTNQRHFNFLTAFQLFGGTSTYQRQFNFLAALQLFNGFSNFHRHFNFSAAHQLFSGTFLNINKLIVLLVNVLSIGNIGPQLRSNFCREISI